MERAGKYWGRGVLDWRISAKSRQEEKLCRKSNVQTMGMS